MKLKYKYKYNLSIAYTKLVTKYTNDKMQRLQLTIGLPFISEDDQEDLCYSLNHVQVAQCNCLFRLVAITVGNVSDLYG